MAIFHESPDGFENRLTGVKQRAGLGGTLKLERIFSIGSFFQIHTICQSNAFRSSLIEFSLALFPIAGVLFLSSRRLCEIAFVIWTSVFFPNPVVEGSRMDSFIEEQSNKVSSISKEVSAFRKQTPPRRLWAITEARSGLFRSLRQQLATVYQNNL